MSFCKFITIKDAEFVGMSNYIDALKDTTFTGSFRFAALFAIVTLVLINVLAFLIALALTQNIKGTNIFRTVFFMPNLIGGIVLGYVWQLIFDAIFARFGLALKLNETLGFWGLVILVCCSMAAWFITRVENVITKIIYLLYGNSFPDGNVYTFRYGRFSSPECTVGNYNRISWIWCRISSLYVLWICEVNSD